MVKINANNPTKVLPNRVHSTPSPTQSRDVNTAGTARTAPSNLPDISKYKSLTHATGRAASSAIGRASDPIVTVSGVTDRVSGHLGRTLDEMNFNVPLTTLDFLIQHYQ